MEIVLSKEQIHDLAVGFHELILAYYKAQAEQENLSADCCVTGEEGENFPIPENGNARQDSRRPASFGERLDGRRLTEDER